MIRLDLEKLHREHGERMAEDMAKPHPLIGNLITPHIWDQKAPGGECLRCGVGYPNTESCP